MKISDPSFKFVIPNSRRFKYIVVLDLVWTYTGLIYILYRKTPISILLTRRRVSVLVVFIVFCMHIHSFAGLIRRTPPPTFSDTAITDRHSDTTIFHLRAHWVRISWSIGSEKSFGHVPPVGVEPSTSCMQSEHPIH